MTKDQCEHRWDVEGTCTLCLVSFEDVIARLRAIETAARRAIDRGHRQRLLEEGEESKRGLDFTVLSEDANALCDALGIEVEES